MDLVKKNKYKNFVRTKREDQDEEKVNFCRNFYISIPTQKTIPVLKMYTNS